MLAIFPEFEHAVAIRCESAKQSNSLNLANLLFLRELPIQVRQLTHIVELNIISNQFKELNGVEFLSRLERVFGISNSISVFPKQLCFLHLTLLNLANNRIESLPEEIGNMTSLRGLLLDTNLLKKLPVSIGQLKNLDTLNLMQNQLECLPEEFENFPYMHFLRLDKNQLTTLVLKKFPSMHHACAKNNPLKFVKVQEMRINVLGVDKDVKVEEI